jgi:ABC-type nitrate/sulfonate/bicarbonate transport system permease component
MTDVGAVVGTPAASPASEDRRAFGAHPRRYVTSGVIVLGWLALWWAAVVYFKVSKDFLPTPYEVAKRIVVLTYEPLGAGALWTHAAASIVRLLSGFAAAIVVGIPLGLLMGIVRPVNYFVRPIFELFRYVPPIAWAPFAIFWFGAGNNAQAYVIFTAAFPPILINAFRGVELLDKRLIDAARTLGARAHTILAEVALPGAMPYVMTGLRIGLAGGWMALIAAEIVASTGSRDVLGYLILQGQQSLAADLTIGAMVVIGIVGTLIDYLLQKLEARLQAWHH